MGVGSSKSKIVDFGGCQWQIGRILGKGAYSTVKLASDKAGGRSVALKLIDKRLLLERGSGSITGALAERDILFRFSHPFFVNMLASFETGSHLAVVLELRSGGSLGYHLGHRPRFADAEARWIAASMLLVLQYLRSCQVAHRDIKPENLLFDERGYVYLSDFNCARVIGRDRPTLTGRAGTLDYMAPEMFLGPYDLSCDMWSFGVLIYRLLYGRVPWRYVDRSAAAAEKKSQSAQSPTRKKLSRSDRRRVHMIKHAELVYPDRSDVSPDAVAFLRRLLNRDPATRPTPSELIVDPWLAGIDWHALQQQQLPAPFVPKPGRANLSPDALLYEQVTPPRPTSKKPLTEKEQRRFSGWQEWTSPRLLLRSSSPASSSSSTSLSPAASVSLPTLSPDSYERYERQPVAHTSTETISPISECSMSSDQIAFSNSSPELLVRQICSSTGSKQGKKSPRQSRRRHTKDRRISELLHPGSSTPRSQARSHELLASAPSQQLRKLRSADTALSPRDPLFGLSS